MFRVFLRVATSLVLVILLLHTAGSSAHAAFYDYTYIVADSAPGKGDGYNVEAQITVTGAHVAIDLFNYEVNQISDGQSLSGLKFNFTGASGLTSFSALGKTATITDVVTSKGPSHAYVSGGNYTPSATQTDLTTAATHYANWTGSAAGSAVSISALVAGGFKDYLIVGHDHLDKIDGSGQYRNANPSVTNSQFNPHVIGVAHFSFDLAGLTKDSKLTNLEFGFSTADTVWQFGTSTTGGNQGQVPEPSSFALLGLGVLGLALRAYRGRKA